jgi:sugar O-acyltransferase (sialic acid O-acetyltransferase NeuD family)
MKVLLIGSAGHSRVILDLLEQEHKYSVAGILDDFRPKGETVLGTTVLGRIEDVAEICGRTGITKALIALNDNGDRMKAAERTSTLYPSLEFINAVHPKAVIGSEVKLGVGTVVMAGAVIHAGSRIGAHCVVGSNTTIDHDCSLGGFVSIGAGANIGGGSSIGSGTAVGLNACVTQKMIIGTHCVIGAGAVVLESVPDLHVAIGVPAKCVRTRLVGEPYL